MGCYPVPACVIMVLEFLATGFEEIEALTPVDMLRRAGIEIITVSINATPTVTGAHGIKVVADTTADNYHFRTI